MASNFSANQYEKEFKSTSLCNWEVPHWYPRHPRRRTTTTTIIANDRGHLLPSVERPNSSPWGHFLNTWQLPPIITKQQAIEINAPQVGNSRWAVPDPNRKIIRQVEKEIKKEKIVVIKQEPTSIPEEPAVESTPEVKKESVKLVFSEKEKLNSPLAIARQGRRAIRHETLERDNDEH